MQTIDRDEMIQVIVDDLRKFMQRDPEGFWDHIEDLERRHLRNKNEKYVAELYEEIIS